ncbi:hypothetical protein Cgig2_000348 [Carnegiea gigantea]|uniref:BTB domain-containing protein n=1 Tax=Carnegiea gigantea TaxID=171969 RepID=A0A9Q1QGA5_9CARY|nr:hypothetical protein Cgig2_000348 [Carnegiea gigantea]
MVLFTFVGVKNKGGGAGGGPPTVWCSTSEGCKCVTFLDSVYLFVLRAMTYIRVSAMVIMKPLRVSMVKYTSWLGSLYPADRGVAFELSNESGKKERGNSNSSLGRTSGTHISSSLIACRRLPSRLFYPSPSLLFFRRELYSTIMGSDSSSVVRLNIGGKKFCTTIDTLTQREPDSMLAAMFSGRHTVCHDADKGYVFVDRDGKHFRHILNWLRDGVVPTLKDSEYAELLREAEYYQLLGLIEGINAALNNKRKDGDDLSSELARRDVIKCIQSERVKFRGVNLSGLDLSKLDLSYVDFSHACLKGVFFSRANLQCAKFRVGYLLVQDLSLLANTSGRCNLKCMSVVDVDAEGSIFHNATLRECEFTGANLRGALLAGANLQSANLQGNPSIHLFYSELLVLLRRLPRKQGDDACLIDCSFCTADLRSAHLQAADLTNANLEGANLEGANLKGAKLTNANLKGANLQRAYLRHVDLRETITLVLPSVKVCGFINVPLQKYILVDLTVHVFIFLVVDHLKCHDVILFHLGVSSFQLYPPSLSLCLCLSVSLSLFVCICVCVNVSQKEKGKG